MYHSHVDEVRDINTGLFGPMIITARGKARADGSPNDVDREIIASFMQVEEQDSWLVNENLLPSPDSLSSLGPKPNPSLRQDGYPWFVKFTINGFVHGSMPLSALTMRKGAARALVPHVVDQRFRFPRAALAREHGHPQRDAHRRGAAGR